MGEHTTTSPPRTRSGVFPARPDQVREARKLISAALEGCPVADDAILCISEFTDNETERSVRPDWLSASSASMPHLAAVDRYDCTIANSAMPSRVRQQSPELRCCTLID